MQLNGFKLDLSAPNFGAYVRDVPQNDEMDSLRESFEKDLFIQWHEGKAYGIPRNGSSSSSFGELKSLSCLDHRWLLAARIGDVLPSLFSKYESAGRRPFAFLGQRDELVQSIAAKLKGLPPLVGLFMIRPRYELDPKTVEMRDGEVFIGIFLRVDTRWEIRASLGELSKAGVDLGGLYVVRRVRVPRQRRLVGRIASLSGDIVQLSESFDGTTSLAAGDVWLEGSKASFSRCLRKLLGSRYRAFDDERETLTAALLTGPAVAKVTETMGRVLRESAPIGIAPDLNCTVGDQISVGNEGAYRTVLQAPPVEYCYDSARTKRDTFAWRGINTYGPFSRDTFSKKSPSMMVVFPDTVQGPVERFLRQFRDGVVPQRGNSAFSGGFAKIFGLANPQFALCPVPFLGNSTAKPADLYRQAVEAHLTSASTAPDVGIVVLQEEHARLPDQINPYLHSKAVLLMAGVPAQELRVPTITSPAESLQYTLQNVAVALYAKMNGVPWTVDHDLTINDELVIGMGACELSGSRFTDRQRFVGITTVFRGDGNYLLGNLSQECSFAKYPEVLRNSTLAILKEIRERNGWRKGDTVRLVFHASKPLKNVEVSEITAQCVKELQGDQNIEFAFLTVSHDHPFLLVDKSQPGLERSGGRKGVYVPERGTIVQAGRFTRLLCTNGPSLIKRVTSPLPSPLLIHLHPESTYRDLTYLTEQVLKFTSLSWRSTLPSRRPVTIYYSELIADLLSRLRSVPDWSPAMLGVKLRASRWFL
jgi:hypothetical protein